MSADPIRPYRPSNGTDGECFMAKWCDRCKHDATEDDPCMILGATMAFSIDDKEYPKEWITGSGKGPRCTAFEPRGAE